MTNNLKFANFKPTNDFKSFIKENESDIKKLINEENFGTLYYIAMGYEDNNDVKIIPQLTRLLYNIDIDPLDYMDEVPVNFLDNVKVEFDLVLPENIKSINEFAFARSWIKSITIPKSCDYFSNNIFQECTKLNYIYYKGTHDEFKEISKEGRWGSSIYSSFPVWVKCTDGKFNIYSFW